jgi:hypothetical protein
MIDDLEEQWSLIRGLWDELQLDDVLTRDWPRERRWQLDLLQRRMRRMDEILEEYEAAEARLLEEMDEARKA